MFNREKEIGYKVEEYRRNLTIDEVLEITPDWYVEAKKRAIIEINQLIKNSRVQTTIKDYTTTINDITKQGNFTNELQSHLSGILYMNHNEVVDFNNNHLSFLPIEVIEGIRKLGFTVSDKLLKNMQ